VGIRNASITNARKTNANIKAVISHSKVSAISAALSFFLPEPFFELLCSLFLLGGINDNPAKSPAFSQLSKKLDKNCNQIFTPLSGAAQAMPCTRIINRPEKYEKANYADKSSPRQ